jgi:hypothetical protein
MNNTKCESCKFSIPIDANERVLLCDNPDLKGYGKNVKHGRRFSCGYGVIWTPPEMVKPAVPLEVLPRQISIRERLLIARQRQTEFSGDFEELRILNAADLADLALRDIRIEAAAIEDLSTGPGEYHD